MKKRVFISVVLILCMLICSCSADDKNAEKDADNKINGTVTVAELDGMYKIQGRKITADEGAALLSTADAFEFNANCEGKVSITLFGKKLDGLEELREDPEDYTGAECYFTGYVDGKRIEERFKLTEGSVEFVLAEDLSAGEHSFKIVRQSELEHGEAYVESVTLTGEITDPPSEKELYIEFIGDSIATGFGNIPEVEYDSEWGGHPVWQDGTQAFAYMTAEALDADYSVVAIEGIGASCGYWDFTMNEVYENYPRIITKDYTYDPERTADIVVIELLSNDGANWRNAGLTPDDILTKSIELVNIAKKKHPDAKIIFSPGSFPKQFEEIYNEEFGGEENGYYIIDLPMNTNGKSGHPDVEGQRASADALISFIEGITG